ncbi:MAG: right-handed parallel beta-helix repeat-containing protein [Thermoplasmatota archaeon]
MMNKFNPSIPTLVVVFALLVLNYPASVEGMDYPPSTRSPPVLIRGEAELASTASAKGWPGTGSGADPYMISHEEFDAAGAGWCLRIFNTTSHIAIGNCRMYGAEIQDQNPTNSGIGLYLWNCRNIEVQGCNISNNEGYGVSMVNCTEVNLFNCTFSMNSNGINMKECDYCSISECSLLKCGNGLYLQDCCACQMETSVIRDCISHGIILWDSSYCIMSNNLLLRNGKYGVTLSSSSENWILNNSFCYNNEAGDEPDDKISQAYDDLGANKWFSWGGPGNHWRDHNTTDINGDGYVDVSYKLAGYFQFDQYPVLLTPVESVPTPALDLEAEHDKLGLNISWEDPFHDGLLDVRKFIVHRRIGSGDYNLFNEVEGYTYTIRDPDVVEGENYVYRVTAVNKMGAGNPSKELIVLRDVTPPIIYNLLPETGSVITKVSVDITWNATDNLGGILWSELQLDNDSWLYMGTKTEHRFWGLDEGFRVVRLRVYDGVGNMKEAATSFYVDTAKPKCNIFQPFEGEVIAVDHVKVIYNITDETTGIASSEISLDDGDWNNIERSGSYIFSELADGEHTVRIRASDRGNNTMTSMVSFIVDSMAPSVRFTCPENGTISSKKNQLVKWEALDNMTGLEVLEMKLDSGKWLDVLGRSEFGFTSLPDGEHVVKLKAIDGALHEAYASVYFTIDTTPPTITDKKPSGESVFPDAALEITFNEAVDEFTLNVTINDEAVLGFSSRDNEYFFVMPFDLAPGRRYAVTVVASDLMGNIMEPFSWSFSVIDPSTELNGWVEGTVVRENGKPVSGALVSFTYLDFVRTDEKGNFRIELRPGNHTCRITADGFFTRTLPVNLSGRQTVNIGSIVLAEDINETTGEEGLPIEYVVAGISIFVGILIIILIVAFMVLRKREREEIPLDPVEEERQKLYSVVQIPADLAEAFIKGPTFEEEEAMLSMMPILERESMDGVIKKDELGRVSAPEIKVEETVGLDLSILDDELEEMDWQDLANPLYDMDIKDMAPMDTMDCYAKLGVPRDAAEKEIKLAYRRLAALYHPDRITRFDKILRERALEEMKRVNYAKEVLLNKEKRLEHDRMLLDSAKHPL